MKNTVYTLVFSLTITTCFYIVWSYLILPDRFMNIFAVQYSVLFPSLIVLFASAYFIHALLQKKRLKHKKILKDSIIVAVAVSILMSVTYLGFINYIYKQKVNQFDKIYEKFLNEASGLTKYYDNDLEVFKEIKKHQEGIVEESGYMNSKFLEDYSKRGACIKSNCVESIGNIDYYIAKLVIESEVIKDILKRVDKVKNDLGFGVGYYRSEYRGKEEKTSKEYLGLLGKKINSSDIISQNSKIYDNDIVILSETEFSYKEFFDIVKKRKNLQEATKPVVYSGYNDVFDSDSLFYSSVYNTFFHTKEFKELMKLLVKFSTYTSKQRFYNDVFLKIYSNRYREESEESKIIRFRVILNIIEDYELKKHPKS